MSIFRLSYISIFFYLMSIFRRSVRPSGVHKRGFSKGGFSNLCVILISLLLNPFTKPPFVNSRCPRGGPCGWPDNTLILMMIII